MKPLCDPLRYKEVVVPMPTLYYVYVDTSGKAAYGEVIPPHCEIIGMSGTEEGAFQIALDRNEREQIKSSHSSERALFTSSS